ncbi:hypothetical protein POL82_04265 [Priestia aryabhattai]|uniref:hypothetical protein n=1 Tax=Priestia TaxID=2800373 RepID=UPI00234E9A0C|nr:MULTISPECIES: hypothetical protein [Priestia]MDC7762663.1 hypothetical protein [Priestia aryabhattai]MED3980881.1 hypothetical protein [Priestia megaterium]
MENKAVTALTSIKKQTNGLFTGGKGYAKFNGTANQLDNIIKEFKQNKHLFLDTTDKSVCHFLAENNEYLQSERFDTLTQIVLILLGYESQAAYDNGDKKLETEVLKDIVIWQYMNQYARKVAGEPSLEL